MIRLEDILSSGNLMEALKRVEENAGAPGIDGVTTRELRKWIKDHPGQITSSIMNGTYKPQPVRRVFNPKEGGSMRPLGIPCCVDRLVQQAIALPPARRNGKTLTE